MRLHPFLPILTACCLFSTAINATVYYVSPTGNDANNGTSQSTPWQTITRVNSSTFAMLPGDQVLFQRGGVYRGQLIAGSPGTSSQYLTIGSYGTGALPVISGSTLVTGWTVHSGNVWKATMTSNVKQVFVGGTRMTLARYPNSGWLFNDNCPGGTLYDAALTQAAGYFNGAQTVVRTTNWSYEVSTVTAFSGGTLSISPSIPNVGTANWGYFIQNKLNLLDQAGEWFYDATTATLYLWAPGGVNPNSLTVEAAIRERGVEVGYQKHHVIIENLAFQHQIANGVDCGVSDHMIVRNCTFTECYRAIGSNGNYNTFTNNVISNTYATAMFMVDQNATISNNQLTNIAMLPGQGENWWGYFGIRIMGTGCTVSNNRLENIGYIAITVEANTLVEKNYINNATALLNDGGGIAFDNADGMIIRDNIILNTQGSLETSASNRPDTYHLMGHGIYFGMLSNKNTIIQNNTVASSSGAGIHVDHTMASTGNQIKDNVLYNNAVQLSLSDISNCSGPAAVAPYYMASYNEVYSGNLLYCLNKDQLCMRMYNCYSALPVDFGTFSNNKYYNPYNELSIWLFNTYSGEQKHFSLERWQVERSEDAGSTRFTEQVRNAYAVTSVLANVPVVNGTFNSNVTGWSGFPGNAVVQHVTGQLDGGCLYANLPNNTVGSEFTMRNPDPFAIQGGQWYRMKCSLKSDTYGQVGIGVKPQSQAVTLLMAAEREYPFSPQRREIEFIFQNTYTENAFVQFQNMYTDPRYWLDNVAIERVAVTPVDPNTENVIFSNSLATAQNFTLPAGCWQEPGGALTSGTVSVNPYRSRVFYKSTSTSCSGTGGTYTVGANVMLSGALNWGTGYMRDDLRAAGLVPAAEPYTAMGQTLENAGATIGSAVSGATGNQAMVDWVLLELRNADATFTVAAKRAAIVRRDGSVVAPDGSALVGFNVPTQGRYLVVRHRNHLGAMTASPLAGNGVTVDFTSPSTALYGTGAMQSDGTRRALWMGNVNFDNAVKYTGPGNDRDLILSTIGGVIPTNVAGGYLGADTNMDAWVGYTGMANDRDFVLTIIGGTVPTATKVEQVP